VFVRFYVLKNVLKFATFLVLKSFSTGVALLSLSGSVSVLQTCAIHGVKNMSVVLPFVICTMTSEETPQQSGPLVSCLHVAVSFVWHCGISDRVLVSERLDCPLPKVTRSLY